MRHALDGPDALITGLRIYVVAVATVVAIVGTLQVRRWRSFLWENQLGWLALALFNFAAFYGCLEQLVQHAPGGARTWITALATTFALQAVSFHPARTAWRRWQNHRHIRRRRP